VHYGVGTFGAGSQNRLEVRGGWRNATAMDYILIPFSHYTAGGMSRSVERLSEVAETETKRRVGQ
jgi:hypothetical protein